MASNHDHHPHILIFPMMAHGHMIPLIDLAALLCQRGLTITIVTTPLNLARVQPTIDRLKSSGHNIQGIQLPFPSKDYGLPENCEAFDSVTNHDMAIRFLLSTRNLKEPFEKIMQQSLPDCVISDFLFYWTSEVAHKFKVPRMLFYGSCCFSSVSTLWLEKHNPQERISDDSEPFLVPGLPDMIELTKAQLPDAFGLRESDDKADMLVFLEKVACAEKESDGIIVNSFHQLETSYVECYKKTTEKPVWTVGPVSLCHKNTEKRSHRGKKSSISEVECLKWLDSKREGSVLYISFGSISFISRAQMEEIKMGLKNSGCSFIWVIKELDDQEFVDGLEEETREKGLIIRGWAPQFAILSHPSVGGFLTHCGWNSTIEAISFGVPMLTWPLFAEQHLNEKLVVQLLGVGVKVGSVISMALGEEEQVEVVKREVIEKAVDRVMGHGGEGEGMRERAKKLGEMARKAMEDGGSSSLNIDHFIQFVGNYAQQKMEMKIEKPEE